ncbi:hypothetical protein [Chitinophaga pinensis]|uniref:Lipoprotein n=1 Tax=Chitinophaga pinensis (strain ATCC 43595 / DSM 2588 / LMG 13176 / NBRC 15968 / NCIMB 11800 / UQM 2034) TaxID=485918 RepID=A0A979FZF0_CHIPD|nr:hypothetical protein [Chitinophaga pinensis]ACU57902.1 hypothetical protein Cpin_0404 [Chitinophaga pinensis DSM 2588]
MKLYSLLGFLCLCLITFASCQKDKAVLASGSCEFKFDGASYSANTAYGEVFDTTVIGKKVLMIQGLTSNLNSAIIMTVIFPDTLKTGTYTNTEKASIIFTSSVSGSDTYESKTATIKITSINSKYAEGTFDGILNNGESEKPLTDGKFKVNIN